MDVGEVECRSQVWEEVAVLTEESRSEQAAFDPETGTPAECIESGIAPIVRLYVHACREGVDLSAVERSLLEGVLNDWLRSYADMRGYPSFEGTGFSLHEVAMEFAAAGDVEAAVERLFDGDPRPLDETHKE
jgi:hypothetical protein